MADYAQISNNQSTAAGYYNTSKHNADNTDREFGDVLKAQEDKNSQMRTGDAKSESADDTDYRKQLQEHMAQMLENIKHGTIQPKIQIGAREYTQDEWKKLLERFDEAEEDLIEQVEEAIKLRMEKAEKQKAMPEAAAEAEAKAENEK